MKPKKTPNSPTLKRWPPILFCLISVLVVGIAAISLAVQGDALSRDQKDSLALITACLDSPVEIHKGVSVSGHVRSLMRTRVGSAELEKLAASSDKFVYDKEHSEIYYVTSGSDDANKSKSDLAYIKDSGHNISSNSGLTSGVQITSLDLQQDQLRVVLKVDENADHIKIMNEMENGASYEKTFDLTEIRQTEDRMIQHADLSDLKSYSKIEEAEGP